MELYIELCKVFDKAVENNVNLLAIEAYVSCSRMATDAVKGLIGIIRLEGTKRHLPIEMFYPTSVKKALTGDGRAEKEVVESAARVKYGKRMYKYMDYNITDAIAMTIVAHRTVEERLMKMEAVRRYIEEIGGYISSKNLTEKRLAKDRKEAQHMLYTLSRMYVSTGSRGKYRFSVPLVEVEQ